MLKHGLTICSFFVALGFQLSGYTNVYAAVALWIFASALFFLFSAKLIWRFLVLVWKAAARIRIRSPVILGIRQPPQQAGHDEATGWIGGWRFRKLSNDGGRVLWERNGSSYRIMESDAYEYFMKLNDNERMHIIEKWGRLRVVYWAKHRRTTELPGIYDMAPVYFDPEGRAWRKSEAAEYRKDELQSKRRDVWGFLNGESPEDYEKKYPGRSL